jgi:hypothetical protein
MIKTALKKFSKKFSRHVAVWVITFVLLSIFFAAVVPANSQAATNSNENASPFRVWGGYAVSDLSYAIAGTIKGDGSNSVASGNSSTAMYDNNGAVGQLAKISDSFYQSQPASFIVWAQDQYYQMQGATSFTAMAATADENPNDTAVYAPGIGFEILRPVMGMWTISRNLVYGVLIVIMIVIAFLILLRRPLGGQEMVTVINSMPGIVLTIVMVTFSYAICGLFIDGIFIGSNVAYNFLIGGPNAPGQGLQNEKIIKEDVYAKPTGDTIPLTNALQPDDPQMSIWQVFSLGGSNVCNRLSLISGATGAKAQTQCAYSYLVPASAQNQPIGMALEKVLEALDSTGITNGLIELILALAVFQTAFKLFFLLLNDYLTLSFYPIIAPFIFLGMAMPGQTMKTIDGFVKTLGASALNFIVIYACFLLLVVFGHTAVDSGNNLGESVQKVGQIQWVPPLLGYSRKQIFDATTLNNNGANIVTSLLVFGLYMAIPNVTDMIKKFLEVNSPFAELAKTGKDITDVSKKAMGYVGMGAQMISGNNWFGGGGH